MSICTATRICQKTVSDMEAAHHDYWLSTMSYFCVYVDTETFLKHGRDKRFLTCKPKRTVNLRGRKLSQFVLALHHRYLSLFAYQLKFVEES